MLIDGIDEISIFKIFYARPTIDSEFDSWIDQSQAALIFCGFI